MRKHFLALLLAITTVAFAQEPNSFYARLAAGVNVLQTESDAEIQPYFNTGYIVSGAVGYHLPYCLSMEAEYAHRRNTMSKIHYYGQSFSNGGAFHSSSYMVNLLWESPMCICKNVWPYLGGGIGYDVQKFCTQDDGFHFKRNKKGFAWQIILGLIAPIFEGNEISLEYQYHKGPLKGIYSHAIELGYIYTFPFNVCESL